MLQHYHVEVHLHLILSPKQAISLTSFSDKFLYYILEDNCAAKKLTDFLCAAFLKYQEFEELRNMYNNEKLHGQNKTINITKVL